MNHPRVHNSLLSFDLPEEIYWLYANRAMTILQYRGGGPELPESSGAFIGQTLADKAILRDGHFLTLLDFRDEFTRSLSATQSSLL